jgi:ArsR family transcriptional regulator
MLSMIASADEVCSCALEAPLEKSQPTISHHTRILAAAGLIVGERRGRWTWWRAVPERLQAVARSLST